MLLLAVLPAVGARSQATPPPSLYASYDAVLAAFAADGRVDYAALKAAPEALERFLRRVSEVEEGAFNTWNEPDQLAFLINLYNAATLELIIDHYPVDGIKDIGGLFKGPWDQEVVPLFGEETTLDALEHDILRKRYDEPRIHMALVCAAASCPPLRREAYRGARLNEQLDEQSRVFLASPQGMRVDKDGGVVYLSAIFSWFGRDFVSRHGDPGAPAGLSGVEQAVARFVASHAPPEHRSFLRSGDFALIYLDYDWSLNDVP